MTKKKLLEMLEDVKDDEIIHLVSDQLGCVYPFRILHKAPVVVKEGMIEYYIGNDPPEKTVWVIE